MGTKVVTPEAVLSFPSLFTPRPARNDGGKAKYECALLFEKQADDWRKDAGLKPLLDAIQAEVQKKYPNPDDRPKKLKWPIKDGDEEEYAGYEGKWYVRAAGVRPPLVVGPNPEFVITDQEEIYPGVIVKAQVDAYSYDVDGVKGITFGLEMVQKRRDGERIAGATRDSASDVFDSVDGGDAAPAPAASDDFFA